MATRTALVTDAPDDGDLEAAQGRHGHAQAINRAPSLINTAGHVCWSFFYLLRSIFYQVHGLLIYIRWIWWLRKITMDPKHFNLVDRGSEPSYFEIEQQLNRAATLCLEYYNAKHPGSEYVLSSPIVKETSGTSPSRVLWTHGNFVARQRKAWCFWFLYGPRTLFFYELNGCAFHGEIVTCTPLDEPVNQAYKFLGFPLWWAKRRSGQYDCVCQTCASRHSVQFPLRTKTFSCGHRNMKQLCKMCYLRSDVLHPSPGEFQHGHQNDAKFSYFCVCA